MKCAWCGRPDSDGTYCSPKCESEQQRDAETKAWLHEARLEREEQEKMQRQRLQELARERQEEEARKSALERLFEQLGLEGYYHFVVYCVIPLVLFFGAVKLIADLKGP